jgi:hypothetical protein
MIIKVDKEAQKELAELADVVLKAAGLQAFNKVGKLLNSITLIEEVDEPNMEPKMKLTRIQSGELHENK